MVADLEPGLAFLQGGGRATELILARDWTGHPLGVPQTWPDTLKATLSLVLNSPESMILCWGPELSFFFNETYFPMLGPRLPWSMGTRFDEVWADGLAQATPIIEEAFAGKARRFINLPWKLATDRGAADTWWTFSYSRVLNPDGSIAGLFILTTETTKAVLDAASVDANIKRQDFLLGLDLELRKLTDPSAIVSRAAEALGRYFGVNQVTYAGVDAAGYAGRIELEWNDGVTASNTGVYVIDQFGADFANGLRRGDMLVVSDVEADARTNAPATAALFRQLSVGAFISLPILKNGQLLAILTIQSRDARFWTSADAQLVQEVADRLWATVERSRSDQSLHQLNEHLEDEVRERTKERDLLARVFETTDSFVHVLDLDYSWLAINPAAADEFARTYGPRPGVGDNLLSMLDAQPDQQAQLKAVWSRALRGEEFTTIIEVTDFAQVRNTYELKFNALRDGDGTLVGAYQVATNINARVEAEEALLEAQEHLRQAQKMEAVGQLTGGLAHDFNNLLAGISGSLQLMQTRVAQGRISEIDRYVNGALGASKRAAALTQRLLAFSRRQTLDPQPTDLNRLVSGMQDLISRSVGPHIAIEAAAAAGHWTTFVDPGQLENALLNLCINARDAMPEGGKITIETANRSMDKRTARECGVAPGQYISLCVSDTGTGMPPEIIARVFDPFFTTKPTGQGTGLGLSMVYGFAGQSGGSVRIYSEVGQGTMVCIYMPRHLGEAAEEEEAGTNPEVPGARHHEKILVVDDEALVRMVVVEQLEELNYAVIEAEDAHSALRILETSGPLSLMITDVGLPGGMNGRQLADAVRQQRPDLQILFITGYAENAVLNHGHLDHGMHVMTKPFNNDDFARRIEALLNKV